MKITSAHYSILENAINEVLDIDNSNGELVADYETGSFPNSDKTKDIQKRFCFDLLYGAGLTSFVCKELYQYLDDTHIYTALKSICPKLNTEMESI
jgi:hypothetical protein